jgi:hypothetical protein
LHLLFSHLPVHILSRPFLPLRVLVVEHRYTGKHEGVKRALKVCVQVNARKGDAKIRESLFFFCPRVTVQVRRLEVVIPGLSTIVSNDITAGGPQTIHRKTRRGKKGLESMCTGKCEKRRCKNQGVSGSHPCMILNFSFFFLPSCHCSGSSPGSGHSGIVYNHRKTRRGKKGLESMCTGKCEKRRCKNQGVSGYKGNFHYHTHV